MTKRERLYLRWHDGYTPKYIKPFICYYNDNMCKGKVHRYYGSSFKTYLCESCEREENSVPDESPLDADYSYDLNW